MTKWVKTAECALDVAVAALRAQAVTVQVRAVHVEPHLGALDVRIEALHQPPKPRRVVKLHQMAHLVRGKVVEHERGRENEPPRERQYARVRARAPTARLVAHVRSEERRVGKEGRCRWAATSEKNKNAETRGTIT